MTITTKAALADELGISRARVSQYVRDGLPVRSDGKLNRDEALNWLNRNIRGLNTGADRGVNRAARLAKPKPAQPKSAPQPHPQPVALTDLLRAAIVAMILRTEAVTAFAVIAAGGSAKTAYAAAGIARMEMMSAGSDVALACDVPDGDDGPLGTVAATPYPPDWPALASIADEPVALDQWHEAEGRLPYWSAIDPPEPPHPWDSAP